MGNRAVEKMEAERVRKELLEKDITILYLTFIGPDGDICAKCSLTGLEKEHMDEVFLDGAAVNGRLLPGWDLIRESEWLLLVPDLSTLQYLPNEGKQRTAFMLGELKEFPLDARACVDKVVAYAAKMQLVPMCGPSICYQLRGFSGKAETGPYKNLPGNAVTEFNIEAVMKLKEMGIHVEYFQQLGEGCSALDLVPSTFLKGLDQCALTRWYVQALAVQKGMEVEFKTPAFTIPMCETSVHFSLWNTERNRNLFFDADDEMELSGTAKHFIAGIMHYFKELTTIMQLSGDRSYPRNWRRFHSASRDEAIVHVPVYLKERKKLDRVGWGKRILFNGFLNPCNLHLCTAAVMLAGLEGVRNKWNPEEEENKTEQTAPPDRSIFDGDNIFRKVLGDDYLAFVLRQDTIC